MLGETNCCKKTLAPMDPLYGVAIVSSSFPFGGPLLMGPPPFIACEGAPLLQENRGPQELEHKKETADG